MGYNFNDEDNKVDLTIRPLEYDRALDVCANVENLKYKLLSGTPVRMAQQHHGRCHEKKRHRLRNPRFRKGQRTESKGPKVRYGLSNLHPSTKERLHRCRYQTRQHETRSPRT